MDQCDSAWVVAACRVAMDTSFPVPELLPGSTSLKGTSSQAEFCDMPVVTENLLLTIFRLPQVLFKKMESVDQVHVCSAIRCKKGRNCQEASVRIMQLYI